jgi:hypothetical protein
MNASNPKAVQAYGGPLDGKWIEVTPENEQGFDYLTERLRHHYAFQPAVHKKTPELSISIPRCFYYEGASDDKRKAEGKTRRT